MLLEQIDVELSLVRGSSDENDPCTLHCLQALTSEIASQPVLQELARERAWRLHQNQFHCVNFK